MEEVLYKELFSQEHSNYKVWDLKARKEQQDAKKRF